MHGGPGKFVYLILAIFLILDFYTFRGLRNYSSSWTSTIKIVSSVVYWLIPLVVFILTFYIMANMSELSSGKLYYRTFYTFMGLIILFYAPKIIFSVFQLGNDIGNGVVYLINLTSPENNVTNIRLLRNVGTVLASGLFFFTFYGIVYGKYHYKINKIDIVDSGIPKSFDGFNIVHISDWHIGSYYGKPKRIQEAVDRINSLEPDIILFTGDLVNNVASEVEEFTTQLSQLKAKYGVYSVLGNHDYGDYVRWESNEAHQQNLDRLKEIEKDIGFRLLNNEAVIIEKNGETIDLLGVENWGLPPFPQHGEIDSALKETNSDFKILMSHDPSHWDEEILNKTSIQLTLSGHTHGMQFGIYTKGLKWSPVKLKYPRWSGLYKENGQQLFVSVGIGYIGFPGRVGMRPEIALLQLKRK